MKLGFIGGGNMAYAIASGVLKSGLVRAEDIWVCDPDERAHAKFAALGMQVSENNAAALNGDFLVVAVKPFICEKALENLAQGMTEEQKKSKVFVTIAAGISVQAIKEYLEYNAKVIRVMPNTPAMVGAGISILAAHGAPVTAEEFETAKAIFESVGTVEVLPESQLNAVIALTSSSPAYIFILIEAMADGGVRDGIPRALAYRMAAQAVLGSAKMVAESGKHPGELKDMVCSPRGTTIEAVAALEENGFRNAILKAMQACTEKANGIG